MLPKTQVVILLLHYSDQLVREVLDSGARSYILKSDASRDLFQAIERQKAVSSRESHGHQELSRIHKVHGAFGASKGSSPFVI